MVVGTDDTPLALFCAFADMCLDIHDFDAWNELRRFVSLPSLPSYELSGTIESNVVIELENALARTGGGIDELAAVVAGYQGIKAWEARALVLDRLADFARAPARRKRASAEPHAQQWFSWIASHIEERVAQHVLTELWSDLAKGYRGIGTFGPSERALVEHALLVRRTLIDGKYDVLDEREDACRWLRSPPLPEDKYDDPLVVLHHGNPFFDDGTHRQEFIDVQNYLLAAAGGECFEAALVEHVRSLRPLRTTTPRVE